MRPSRLVLGIALIVLVLAPAGAAASSPSAARDTARATGNNFIVDDFSSYAIDISAFSDPNGGHPGGWVSFEAGVVRLPISGPVSCLNVSGNTATLIVNGPFPSFPGALAFVIRLTDNGGNGLDRFDYYPVLPELEEPVDCLTGAPFYVGGLLDGRAVVSDVSDTVPPRTAITKRPPNQIDKRWARFAFRSNEPGSSFECQLDQGGFAACSSPLTLRHLQPGRHTFSVRAIDAAGNVDPTPATDRFRVLG